MSNATIDQAKVDQFSSNVWHLSQQKNSRLKDKVRNESLKGEDSYYDRYGLASRPQKRTARHANTEYSAVDHSRRKVYADMYNEAILVDNLDTLSMIHDPTSQYAQALSMVFGREMDYIVRDSAFGTAYAGRSGGTSVSFPDSQTVVAHDGTTLDGVNLNIKTLRKVKQNFDAAEVDPSLKRYFALASSQVMSLLAQTEVTNSDYNTIKTLVQGEINSFMGFEFVRLELLSSEAANVSYNPATGAYNTGTGTIAVASVTARDCIAWAQDGILLAIKEDVKTRIGELESKNYNMHVWYEMCMGGTRMEEVKVQKVICAEVN